MNITIRRATAADAETVARFNQALAEESEGVTLDPNVVRQGVEEAFRDPAKGFYTVAEADGRVIGQMMVTFEWSDWRNGTFWWLQSVYVRPEYRKQGVYRRIYEHVLDEAKARNDVCGVRLYVDKDNRTAQQVYQRLGLHPAQYAMYEVDFVLERR
jgi:GNAT superfamily N-acetyltransferase